MAEFNGTILISHNPVTAWETYSKTLHVAEEPSETGFYGLSKEERADKGYHKASFAVRGHQTFLSDFMENGLGRMVEVKSPNGITIWEGMIEELELDVGSAVHRTSIREMYNRVWMRYRVRGATTTSRSTTQNDTDSQVRFGIKSFVLSGGELESSAAADQACKYFLNEHKWPISLPVKLNPGGTLAAEWMLSVRCMSFFDTLNWNTYNQTASTDNTGASTQITTIVSDSDVGQFVNSMSIDTNATLVSKVYDADRRGGDIVRDIARLGDSSNKRWLARMIANREFVFREAAPPELPD